MPLVLQVLRMISLIEMECTISMVLTFVPSATFVVVCHDLTEDHLSEHLIMRDAVQHLAKGFHQGHEINSSLKANQVREKPEYKIMQSRLLTLKMGLGDMEAQFGSSAKASGAMKVNVQRSVMASSSCGWKTLTKKSSKKEVKVPIAISESTGTRSLSRWMNDNEGGRRRPILNTLGSIRSLWPVPEFPCLDCDLSPVVVFCDDLVTSPGTEDLNISSKSSRSAFISDDFLSISDNLNIFCDDISAPDPR